MTEQQYRQGKRGTIRETADEAKEKVGELAGQAKEKAGELVDQAKETAGQFVEQAQEQVTSQLTDQKDHAAEQIGGVAEAVRQSGQQLREQDHETVAQYADQAADRIDQLSTYLQEHDLRQLVGEVERFARREPEIFLVGAFALGLLGARMLKSSRQRSEYSGDFDRQRYAQDSYPRYDQNDDPGAMDPHRAYQSGSLYDYGTGGMDRPLRYGPDPRPTYERGMDDY